MFFDYSVFPGLFCMLFGGVIAFFGRKFFPITIFATGGLAGFGITMLLVTMLSFINTVNEKTTFTWVSILVSLGISTIVGVFVGFILKQM